MVIENPTKGQFEAEVAKGKTLVDFWASWCGPCRAQAPIAHSLTETTDVKLVKVDVDECGELAAMFGVTGIPTLLCYVDGNLVKKFVGVTSFDELKVAFGL